MINTKTKLTVFTYISSSFSDISNEASDSTRDTAAFTLTDSDYLYVGYYKPINSFYAHLTGANTNSATLTVEYYDGTTWSSVTGSHDDTKAFQRSAFIQWDRNQTNEAKTTVNSTELFWYRISTSSTLTEVTLQTVTGLFSCDQDLEIENPDITDSAHLSGKTSHFNAHLSARNDIIQSLRNQGFKKVNWNSGDDKDITFWDILEIDQLKQASIYLALSKIYFNFSDEIDDKFQAKSEHYYKKYEKAFKLAFLSVDKDDDGLKDEEEELPEVKSVRVVR